MPKGKRQAAKEYAGEQTNRLRAGRIANFDRLRILEALGEIAKKKFDRLLSDNHQGYDLDYLQGSLKYEPNVDNFENFYYTDTGNEEDDRILDYFEYGTGMYNTKTRVAARKSITSKTPGKAMRFRKPYKGQTGAMSVKGVRPIFMFRKTIKSMEFNRPYLQKQIRLSMGI